jgi:hypothetical protein
VDFSPPEPVDRLAQGFPELCIRCAARGASGGGHRAVLAPPALHPELLPRAGETPRLHQAGAGHQADPVGQPAHRPGHVPQRSRSAPVPA